MRRKVELQLWQVFVAVLVAWVLVFHVPILSPRIWLFMVDYGDRWIVRPAMVGRDPRNPQRMIIDTFLDENKDRVKGRCLEFDEDVFMERFGCTQREILKFQPGSLRKHETGPTTTTTYGDLFDNEVYETSSIDTVFFTEVLEHTLQPQDAAAALYRILRPCGTVLLTTPFICTFAHHQILTAPLSWHACGQTTCTEIR